MSKEGSLSQQADAWLHETEEQGQWNVRTIFPKFNPRPITYQEFPTHSLSPDEAAQLLIGVFSLARQDQEAVESTILDLIHLNHPELCILPVNVLTIAKKFGVNAKKRMLAHAHKNIQNKTIINDSFRAAICAQYALLGYEVYPEENTLREDIFAQEEHRQFLLAFLLQAMVSNDELWMQRGLTQSVVCEYILGIGNERKRKKTGVRYIDEVLDELHEYMLLRDLRQIGKDLVVPDDDDERPTPSKNAKHFQKNLLQLVTTYNQLPSTTAHVLLPERYKISQTHKTRTTA